MSTTTTPNTNTAPPSGAPREAHQRANFQGQKISRAAWNKTHGDFKTVIGGQSYVLQLVDGKGTCLVPVEIVADSQH